MSRIFGLVLKCCSYIKLYTPISLLIKIIEVSLIRRLFHEFSLTAKILFDFLYHIQIIHTLTASYKQVKLIKSVQCFLRTESSCYKLEYIFRIIRLDTFLINKFTF